MAPVSIRRSPASTVPTVVSLSKLFSVIPAIVSNRHVKRGVEFAINKAEEEGPPADSADYMFKLILSAAFVILGGIFAGLTLALMGSDDLNLRVLATSSSDPKERADANKVLRLLSKGRHWVLVVLLLSNVIVNESLPIFLDPVLGGGVRAVIVSTVMIVIFGEVIPQAVCVRYGLQIGGACAPMVHAMMILFAPIAWPIAKLLDWVLGHDAGHTYKKAELKSFLQFHREGEEPLRDDEISILNGVLSLNDRKVNQIMTPIGDCLTLGIDKILDSETIDHILLSGFSRIPVYEAGQPDNFIGMLLVKRLISYNPEDELPVSKFPLLPLPEAKPDLNCFQALDYFQTGRAHLLLVSETPGRRGGALGVLSLEDLIEEIIGEEIIDETDRYQDNHTKRKAQRKATATIMRGIIERQRVINAMSRRPSGNHSPAPNAREGVLVNFTETPTIHNEPEAHDYLDARTSPGKHIESTIYSSPKPRLVDIEEMPSPDSAEDTKSPNHHVDVSVIAKSPESPGMAIVSAPAGDTKADGAAADIAEEAVKNAAANGEGKLIDVTVTEESKSGEEASTRVVTGAGGSGSGSDAANADADADGTDAGDDAEGEGEGEGEHASDSTAKAAPASTGQGASKSKKKRKGKKK